MTYFPGRASVSAGTVAIRSENLCRHYRMGEALIRAVDGLSLEIRVGRFCRAAGNFRLGKIFRVESDCRS